MERTPYPIGAWMMVTMTVALAGCSYGNPGAPSPGSDGVSGSEGPHVPELAQRTWILASGDASEVNLRALQGQMFEADFVASRPLDWDIHAHSDTGGTLTVQQGSDASALVQHTAERDGGYSVLWVNPVADSVRLDVTVRGNATFVDSYP